MPGSTPFSIAVAFSDNPFGGNPAAVIFLDTSLPLEDLGKLARNFNQPILVVVSPTSLTPETDERSGLERRSIRFFTPRGDLEPPICGHGTLAAAKLVFDLPEVIAAGKNIIQFETAFGKRLEATKMEDGWIEIEIPSTTPEDIDHEKERLKAYVEKAFGRDVKIKDIKSGASGAYKKYIMIEIDESEDLAGSVVDANALIGNGYIVNVFTSTSSDPGYSFVSRMFAPTALVGGEDHVRGTAHGLLTPYWSTKLDLKSGDIIKARQVSSRGGELGLVWDKDRSTLRLRGQCSVFATGEIET